MKEVFYPWTWLQKLLSVFSLQFASRIADAHELKTGEVCQVGRITNDGVILFVKECRTVTK